VKNSVQPNLNWALGQARSGSNQQKPQPREQAAKVVAGGGKHSVDGVAAGMGKVIAAHAVVLIEVADDGLDGGPPWPAV
jgi:hypothetical protein